MTGIYKTTDMENNTSNSNDMIKQRLDFLYFATKDGQDNIKFVDYKTAFIITLLSGYAIAFFTDINEIISKSGQFCCFFWIFFYLFIFFFLVSAYITYKVIRPIDNPIKNLVLGKSEAPNLECYLSANIYSHPFASIFINSSNAKLDCTHEKYFDDISKAEVNEIIHSLVYELLKISFIRNLKHKRLRALYKSFTLTTFLIILIIILKHFALLIK